jgi:hypothetical protein
MCLYDQERKVELRIEISEKWYGWLLYNKSTYESIDNFIEHLCKQSQEDWDNVK